MHHVFMRDIATGQLTDEDAAKDERRLRTRERARPPVVPSRFSPLLSSCRSQAASKRAA
jgi:hypothetical protein